jgi:hypothetical protein
MKKNNFPSNLINQYYEVCLGFVVVSFLDSGFFQKLVCFLVAFLQAVLLDIGVKNKEASQRTRKLSFKFCVGITNIFEQKNNFLNNKQVFLGNAREEAYNHQKF